MRIQEQTELAAPISAVLALMTDEGFQREKAARVGAVEFSMTEDVVAGSREVVTRRRMETGNLPEFIKPMVNPTMLVVERERWGPAEQCDSAPFHGSFDIDVAGAPVQLRGHVRLEPRPGGGCTLRFEGEWTATVPLFKEKVAEVSAGSVRSTIEAEFALLQERLSA